MLQGDRVVSPEADDRRLNGLEGPKHAAVELDHVAVREVADDVPAEVRTERERIVALPAVRCCCLSQRGTRRFRSPR